MFSLSHSLDLPVEHGFISPEMQGLTQARAGLTLHIADPPFSWGKQDSALASNALSLENVMC